MTAEQKFKISLYLTGAISAEPVAKVTIDDAINAYSGTFTAAELTCCSLMKKVQFSISAALRTTEF